MASGVEFDEDSFASTGARRPGTSNYTNNFSTGNAGFQGFNAPNSNDPAMVQWLMKHGFAKSRKAAEGVLIGVIAVNMLIMFVTIKFFLL